MIEKLTFFIDKEWYYCLSRSFFFHDVLYISRTNTRAYGKEQERIRKIILPHKDEIIENIADICIKYNVEFDSWNIPIPPFNIKETIEMENKIEDIVNNHKTNKLKSKL